jgi:hypothetical protein
MMHRSRLTDVRAPHVKLFNCRRVSVRHRWCTLSTRSFCCYSWAVMASGQGCRVKEERKQHVRHCVKTSHMRCMDLQS